MAPGDRHRIIRPIIGILSFVTVAIYVFQAVPRETERYNFKLNLFVVAVLFAAIVNIALFVVTFTNKSSRGLLQWFRLLPLLNCLWLLIVLFQSIAIDSRTSQFWQHLAPMAWLPIPVVLLYFTLSYVDDIDIPRGISLWHIPLIMLFIMEYIAGSTELLAYTHPVNQTKMAWGFESDLAPSANFAYVWAITLIFICLILFIQSYRRSRNKLERTQRRIFVIGIGIYICGATFLDIIYASSPLNVTNSLPPMGFAYNSLMALVIGYGIFRYGIFKVSPASLSAPILHNLTEAVLATNRDLRVEFANGAAEVLTGYPMKRLKGAHISELFDADTFRLIINNMHNDEAKTQIDDTEIKDHTGTLVPVSLSVGQVQDERMQRAGYIFVLANITELKKKTIELAIEKASVEQKVRERTQELSEEKAKLSASINSLELGYVMMGPSDEVQIMNPAAAALLKRLALARHESVPHEWTAKEIQKVIGNDEINILSSITKSREDSRQFEFKEIQIAERVVHVFLAPVSEHEEVIGTVLLIEDITDEKALNRSKDEFFIIASHELRTPLTKIRGSAEVIKDVYKADISNDEIFKMLTEIEQSSGHLIDIVNDFIQMSELEQGKIKFSYVECNIGELVREVVNNFAKTHEKTEVTYRVQTHGDELHARVDKTYITHLLQSLLDNAMKFTVAGEIRVELSRVADAMHLRIIDQGKGIKLENQSLLFRKFQQAGSSLLSRDGEGTGLGLYIAKLIVDQMGGEIGLESSEEGKGSVFYIRIPIAKTEKTTDQD